MQELTQYLNAKNSQVVREKIKNKTLRNISIKWKRKFNSSPKAIKSHEGLFILTLPIVHRTKN